MTFDFCCNIILSVNNAGSVTLASVIQNAINIPNKIICFFMSAKFVVLSGLWYLFMLDKSPVFEYELYQTESQICKQYSQGGTNDDIKQPVTVIQNTGKPCYYSCCVCY